MNLILLDSEELDVLLPPTDPRARHIVDVLRRSEGDVFDVGLSDGRVGKGRVENVGEDGLRVSVEWTGRSAELHPVTLIIGMPRPQTARRLLREMTGMGARRLIFSGTDRGEPGYARSSLWSSGEFERHLRSGAEQAFNPRLPDLVIVKDLEAAIEMAGGDADRIALDNYEAPESLPKWSPSKESAVVAMGAERGWSGAERDLLRRTGFAFYHLGSRVLRLETAAVAAMSIALSRMDLV